jgi:DNA-binding HxlR family transcriptional regulator
MAILGYYFSQSMSLKIEQKAEEIALATLKVAMPIKRFELKKRLEFCAYDLLSALQDVQAAEFLTALRSLSRFTRIAESLGQISKNNAAILLREISGIESDVVSQTANAINAEIESVFKRQKDSAHSKGEPSEYSSEDSAKRQTAIIESMKVKGGKVQLRDLITALPDVSERTIRNDISRLISEGRVVRNGAGGPSSFYSLVAIGQLPAVPAPQGVIKL